jgi:hypothetical protein
MPSRSWAPQWHFLIVQLYHMASQIQGCIVGAQTIQFHDELITDIGDENPSCQWPPPQSILLTFISG